MKLIYQLGYQGWSPLALPSNAIIVQLNNYIFLIRSTFEQNVYYSFHITEILLLSVNSTLSFETSRAIVYLKSVSFLIASDITTSPSIKNPVNIPHKRRHCCRFQSNCLSEFNLVLDCSRYYNLLKYSKSCEYSSQTTALLSISHPVVYPKSISWINKSHGSTNLMDQQILKVDQQISWINKSHGSTNLMDQQILKIDQQISWINKSHGSTNLMDQQTSWINKSHGSTNLMDQQTSWINKSHGSTNLILDCSRYHNLRNVLLPENFYYSNKTNKQTNVNKGDQMWPNDLIIEPGVFIWSTISSWPSIYYSDQRFSIIPLLQLFVSTVDSCTSNDPTLCNICRYPRSL